MNNLDNSNEMNKNVSSINVRCPSCHKLFSVSTNLIYVDKPEFNCTSCSSAFWVSFSEALESPEIVGHLLRDSNKTFDKTSGKTLGKASDGVQHEEVDSSQMELDFELAEKDFVKDGMLDTESDFNDLKNESIVAKNKVKITLPEEESLWLDVLDSYQDRAIHNKFIDHCKSRDKITYAVNRYDALVKVNPHDRIAKSFLSKLNFSVESQLDKHKSKGGMLRYWPLMLVAVGLILLLAGLIVPSAKNLIGIGIALVFFTLALQALIQSESKKS